MTSTPVAAPKPTHAQDWLDLLLAAPLSTASADQARFLLNGERTEVIDWAGIFHLAGELFLSPWLHRVIKDASLDDIVPLDVLDALREIHVANTDRNQRLLEDLDRVTGTLGEADVSMTPLKGIAMLAEGVYDSPGDRMLSDIDILVDATDIPRLLEALAGARYQQRVDHRHLSGVKAGQALRPVELADPRNASAERHHLPPFTLGNAHAQIEIHTRITLNENDRAAAITRSLRTGGDRFRYRRNGVELQGAPTESHLLHCLYHYLVSDSTADGGIVDYRHLQDGQRLYQRVIEQGRLVELGELLERTAMAPEFTLFLWQIEHILRYPRRIDIPGFVPDASLLDEFLRVNRSDAIKYWRFWRRWGPTFLKRRLRALLLR